MAVLGPSNSAAYKSFILFKTLTLHPFWKLSLSFWVISASTWVKYFTFQWMKVQISYSFNLEFQVRTLDGPETWYMIRLRIELQDHRPTRTPGGRFCNSNFKNAKQFRHQKKNQQMRTAHGVAVEASVSFFKSLEVENRVVVLRTYFWILPHRIKSSAIRTIRTSRQSIL